MKLFNRAVFDKAREGQNGTDGSNRPRRPRLGLALGAGAARGWAHIGILRTLEAAGIRPDVVAGTSVGAVVGACYAAGKLAALEEFARSLTKRRLFGLMDFSFSGAGLVTGGRLRSRLTEALGDIKIEDLPTSFAAVATEMGSGHEVWLDRGLLVQAIRASYALPGIFEPVRVNGRWLFDGALVNPVPITVCRAHGAEIVISLNLNTELRRTTLREEAIAEDALAQMQGEAQDRGFGGQTSAGGFLPSLRGRSRLFRRQFSVPADGPPGIATAMVDAFNITQDRIARSRLAGDPPDIAINAKLGHIGFFDFHRADEMIDIGREAARRALPDIRELVSPDK